MATTIKLLATYQGYAPNTIITVSDAVAAALGGNATTNLAGGVQPVLAPAKPTSTKRKKTLVGTSGLPASFIAAGTANQNWHLTTVAARAFNGIEVIYANVGATVTTYDHTAVAAASSIATPALKVTPDQPWNVAPGAVVLGTTGTVPLPLYLGTGVIPCRSVPPMDGGRFPYAHVRVHTVGAVPAYANISNMAAAWDAGNTDWPYQCFVQGGGDYTSVSQASFTSTTRTNIAIPAAIRFHYDSPGITGLAVGDSIMGGDSVVDGSPGRASYAFRAVRLMQDEGYPFDLVNTAISGNTWAQYSPRAKAFMDMIKPDFVLIPSFTPNDPFTTQAQADTQWRNCMELVSYALALDIIPIISTPAPNNGTSANSDAFRLSIRARALASGFAVLDLEPIWSDRATPARWAAGMNDAGNSTHPGAAGNAAAGAALAAVLKSIFY